ncbi:hypothetical protein [Nostoc sp.]
MQLNPYWRFQVIYGLLWASGNIGRSRALSSFKDRQYLAEWCYQNSHQSQ